MNGVRALPVGFFVALGISVCGSAAIGGAEPQAGQSEVVAAHLKTFDELDRSAGR